MGCPGSATHTLFSIARPLRSGLTIGYKWNLLSQQLLESPHVARTPLFATTREPTNIWVVRTLPTLQFVLERLGLFYVQCNAVLKASEKFSSEEYGQRFRIKLGGVSPSSALGWASCSNIAIATYSL